MKESYLSDKIQRFVAFLEYLETDTYSELESYTLIDLKEELTHTQYLYDRLYFNNGFEKELE